MDVHGVNSWNVNQVTWITQVAICCAYLVTFSVSDATESNNVTFQRNSVKLMILKLMAWT